MLSPLEQKQTIGEVMLRRSTRSPSRVTISAVASRLPTKSSSTIHCISSALRLTWPPHHFSNSMKRGPSVSTLDHRLYFLVHNVLDGFRFSKFSTSMPPSNLSLIHISEPTRLLS